MHQDCEARPGKQSSFFIAGGDITESLSKRFVTLTKFLDMHSVFVEVLLTIRWQMQFLVSWRKSEGAYCVWFFGLLLKRLIVYLNASSFPFLLLH